MNIQNSIESNQYGERSISQGEIDFFLSFVVLRADGLSLFRKSQDY